MPNSPVPVHVNLTLRQLPLRAMAVGGGVVLSALPLAAAEYCVSCSAPDAHYVCAFEDVDPASEDARLKLLCISELAHGGGHASCSVDRTQKQPCPGERKVLATPEGFGSGPSGAATAATSPDPRQPDDQKPAAANDPNMPGSGETAIEKAAPPKTVEEAVSEGAKAAGDGIKKTGEGAVDAAKSAGGMLENAGSAVAHAAKKSWQCLSTFFGSC